MQKIIITLGIAIAAICAALPSTAQNLQLHYDLRQHTPTLYFEFWKMRDSGQHLIKPGGFLLKTEADFQGAGDNIGKFYVQVGQSFRAWKPKIFLRLQYSGGGGITEPKQYSYYITNTYQAGAELPLKIHNTFLTLDLGYKCVSYTKPTNDPILTLYWYHGFFNYKLEFAGDFSIWTENRNHGDELTAGQKGKQSFFFAEPQFWYNLTKILSLGSRLNCYYHVNNPANVFQTYPAIAARIKL